MCCTRLAENTGRKNDSKNHHVGTIPQLCRAISSQVRHVSTFDNRKKNLLNSNISLTCPYNMVNFGPLAAEMVSLVWGTPANFNGFASWQHYCTALELWASAKVCSVEQKAPPTFGRAAITLFIGPHSSLSLFSDPENPPLESDIVLLAIRQPKL